MSTASAARAALGENDIRLRSLRQAFPTADAASLAELAAISTWCSVPGSCSIIREGEPADTIYVVVTGIFAAFRRGVDGRETLASRMGAGAIIGEIGFITGQPRTATVRAMRNSEALCLARADFERVTARHSGVLMAVCATVVQRLRTAQAPGTKPPRLRTFCLVPAGAGVDAAGLLRGLAAPLQTFGTVATVTAAQAAGHTAAWFAELEHAFDHVLYLAAAEPGPWTTFCLRQADAILLLACGETHARPQDVLREAPPGVPLLLVLRWQAAILAGRTAAWLDMLQPASHFHIRTAPDLARLARLLSGHGVGVVLSGGGARGLAHIGVLSALRDYGVPVDVIGGTSIGGIVAMLAAFEWDLEAIAPALIAAFGRRRLTDFALSRTALLSERSFTRAFDWLGATELEDAPIAAFCLSTNLTDGVTAVHRRGRLTTWLRATAAVPGLFPPVTVDGAIHVDGGVLNNLPVDVMRSSGVSTVIAVNVSSFGERVAPAAASPGLVDLLWRVGTIGNCAGAASPGWQAHIVLKPAVDAIPLFGWRHCDQAIAAGRAEVERCGAELRRLLASRGRHTSTSS